MREHTHQRWPVNKNMTNKLTSCFSPLKQCFLAEDRQESELSQDLIDKNRKESTISSSSSEASENQKNAEFTDTRQICACCRPLDFRSNIDRKSYKQALEKGRRGVVLSLDIDQITSYVTALNSEEHLRFRFHTQNSQQNKDESF